MFEMRDAAMDYVRRGWPVFPRLPKSKGARREPPSFLMTSNLEHVHEHWTRWYEDNIGICTGNGLAVLDIDDLKVWEQLANGREIITPTHRTSRGMHLLFRIEGHRKTYRLLRGVDIYADEGLGEKWGVMMPPSIHPDGTKYEWTIGLDTPMAPLPEWLLPKPPKPGCGGCQRKPTETILFI